MAAGPRVGEPAPDFELDGTDGRFRLSEHRGERVVLLFYPGDETPVCTKQFCSYAEREDELAALDATVVGISAQDVASHRSFQRAHGIPVPLLADADRTVAEAYGVARRVLGTQRAVFIVDEVGRVRYANPAAGALTGASAADLRDSRFIDRFHADSHELVRQRVLSAPSPAVAGLRYEARLAGADDRWVELTGRALDFVIDQAI